jgi:hypothetical protein
MPVEQINNTTGTVEYLHHDQAGSTRLLTGSTGKAEGSYSYSPYGTPEHTGTATTSLGWDGQYTSTRYEWAQLAGFDHARRGTHDYVYARLTDGSRHRLTNVLQGQRVIWDGGQTDDIVSILSGRLAEKHAERIGP